MNDEMRFPSLIARDVPPELDRRILAVARERASELRFRRVKQRWIWGSSVFAVAATFVVVSVVFFLPGMTESRSPSTQQSDLLAMSNWVGLEQENYNLSFELYSGRIAVSELAEAFTVKGL